MLWWSTNKPAHSLSTSTSTLSPSFLTLNSRSMFGWAPGRATASATTCMDEIVHAHRWACIKFHIKFIRSLRMGNGTAATVDLGCCSCAVRSCAPHRTAAALAQPPPCSTCRKCSPAKYVKHASKAICVVCSRCRCIPAQHKAVSAVCAGACDPLHVLLLLQGVRSWDSFTISVPYPKPYIVHTVVGMLCEGWGLKDSLAGFQAPVCQP